MKKLGLALILLVFCLALAGCGDYVDSETAALETGDLSIGLTDAATDEYRAVYVTIDEVQVHMGSDEEDGEEAGEAEEEGEDADNWETVASPMETYDLLALVNGVIEELGISSLETGTYEKMRLIIGTTQAEGLNILSVGHPYANYVIDDNNQSHELKIPSGINTGIKIFHSFDISANRTTELILDFDAPASVVKAGTSGNWLLKPTIKVLNTQEHAIVSGNVFEMIDEESYGVEGALVSLQYETSDAGDEKDAVTVQAATVSDTENADEGIESGDFSLLVQPGSYRLVAYKDDYAAACYAVDATAGETTVQDVDFTASDMGMVQGTVTISGGSGEQYATLSFRRSVDCEGADEACMIEVRSTNSVTGFWYDADLPTGTYSLVASSSGMETEVYTGIVVTDGDIVSQHVNLSPLAD
jgi:hypothetical protein